MFYVHDLWPRTFFLPGFHDIYVTLLLKWFSAPLPAPSSMLLHLTSATWLYKTCNCYIEETLGFPSPLLNGPLKSHRDKCAICSTGRLLAWRFVNPKGPQGKGIPIWSVCFFHNFNSPVYIIDISWTIWGCPCLHFFFFGRDEVFWRHLGTFVRGTSSLLMV